MKTIAEAEFQKALDWCAAVLGPITVMSDHSKVHGGHASSTCRLRTSAGFCYLKVHQSQSHWNNEVCAYERWADAFGGLAPRLLAARDQAPLALVVGEVPGQIVENGQFSVSQERAIWRMAGAALIALHSRECGTRFGPCLRDGGCAEAAESSAVEHVSARFGGQIEHAICAGYVDATEQAVLCAAHALTPAFACERPIPCHRDYCPANWLVNAMGALTGVIDFEFSLWDVRVADFSRDPNWAWVRRPDLVTAFFEGYGWSPTATQEQQLIVAHAEYALGAIIWGRENAFFGFEREGREAISRLAVQLS